VPVRTEPGYGQSRHAGPRRDPKSVLDNGFSRPPSVYLFRADYAPSGHDSGFARLAGVPFVIRLTSGWRPSGAGINFRTIIDRCPRQAPTRIRNALERAGGEIGTGENPCGWSLARSRRPHPTVDACNSPVADRPALLCAGCSQTMSLPAWIQAECPAGSGASGIPAISRRDIVCLHTLLSFGSFRFRRGGRL
jgi:hypothetical protein